jgi:hypothetical protein
MTHGYILKTDVDFFNAILFRHNISVTQDGEQIGSGVIISQSQHAVKMADAHFFKHSCNFMVCA